MKRILAVALMIVAMAGLGSTAAFADPPPAPGLPGQFPGPNSSRADGQIFSHENLADLNHGHCQSQNAKQPGNASEAQDLNPAQFTAGQDFGGSGVCGKL